MPKSGHIVLEISKGGCVILRTRGGEGVQKPEISADVLNGSPLSSGTHCALPQHDCEQEQLEEYYRSTEPLSLFLFPPSHQGCKLSISK